MKKIIISVIMVVALTGCASTHLQVSAIDPKTGYFPCQARYKADIIIKEKYDLDSMKSLILVPGGRANKFSEEQVRNIKYFDDVINLEDLQRLIIQKGLQEKVPSISLEDKIGLNKAYTNYKPFLLLIYANRKDDKDSYAQLGLTDPKNLKNIFVAEIYIGRNANDQTVLYPLFNALLDYIRENSKTYK